MFKLIKNEFIKVFKRKNIYFLLLIGLSIISIYNIVWKIDCKDVNMQSQYQKVYNNDKLILENYNNLNIKDSYEDITERMALEKYALENNIQYNILLNSQNKNVYLPADARILLMKVFNNFEIIIIFVLTYISSTIITEEYNTGTIKYVLTKPHTRFKILLSKVIFTILITALITAVIVIYQYLLGGILFGFESYNLEAIRYNSIAQNIETMPLLKYMVIIIISKFAMYLLLNLISLVFGIITNNISLNILISLGLYFTSKIKVLINSITKYLFIFNWDISNYLFKSANINKQIIISSITFVITFTLLVFVFKNKDIKNE